MNRKPLTVYKASAGSGKTFTLATEYIRLGNNCQNPTTTCDASQSRQALSQRLSVSVQA